MTQREAWGSRIGLILAVAGNAIGLGNFLRFPVQCASHGGGAFMIPYFIALLFLGIPLMWIEWSMGRFGGSYGHGTTPGMFHRLWNHPASKYLGSLGILVTFGVGIYYVYVESWTLGYAFFSLTGKFTGITSHEQMGAFLGSYQGRAVSEYFGSIDTAYIFFLVTFLVNMWVLWYGVSKGIERLAKVAMPLLFLFGIVLVIRVLTLGTPDPSQPENSVLNGLGFIWNPRFESLLDAKVWLAAAGQIFFTLSVGFGCIQTYASYLKRKEDVALNGLTTTGANEFAEVVLGGSIAIPIAVAFFGIAGTAAIAKGGSFDLGFQAMPLIFLNIPLGQVFGTLWFLLLFFAGITSSVAIVQPFVAFLQDEFQWSRRKAVTVMGLIWFICAQPVIFFLKHGFLDEMDFWLGTFGVVAFAFLEVIVFVWIFGADRAWEEINLGADIKIPRFFYYVIKYVTPFYLLVLLISWGWQDGIDIMLFKNVSSENLPYVVSSRVMMTLLFIVINVMVYFAFKKHKQRGTL